MEWDSEKECFQTFAQECANFYCIQHDPFLLDSFQEDREKESEAMSNSSSLAAAASVNPALYKKEPWRWTMEYVVFPALKSDFIPPRKMAEDGSFLQIADLHDLYKVFERC